MKRVLLMLLFVASVAGAQTLQPIHAEYGKKASGTFTYTNNTLSAMVVTIEPMSATFDATSEHLHAVDPATEQVKISEMSARLGIKETHEFSYKIQCDKCVIVFLTGAIVGHTQITADKPAFAIRVIIPETIYLCGESGAKNCRKNTLDAAGYKDPQTRTVSTPQ